MRKANRQKGFTVIELILSAIILVIILTIVGDFLISSLRLTEQTEARNEMQVNLRSAMEMVYQDLFSSGANGVDGACEIDFATVSPFGADLSATRDHSFLVRYCDPYTDEQLVIEYEVNPDSSNGGLPTLFRKRSVGTASDANAATLPAVPGIAAFELELFCDTPATVCDPSDAAFDAKQLVSIKIKMTAQSTWKSRGANNTCTFGGTTCPSQAGYHYEYAEQGVSPPNLKFYYD